MNIKKVAVIGAGVMGARIAAQISNTGVAVYLLDVVPKDHSTKSKNRNLIAESAIQKLLKSTPEALMHKKNIRLISPGNIEDHLKLLVDVDWVIEAVVEDLDIKQNLYKKLEQVCNPQTIFSSNTSTLPLKNLLHNFSQDFQSRFMITHFFNPPRYMRLLELVSSPTTKRTQIDAVKSFAELKLGKDCVECNDTIGFIANRIGIYWLQCGLLTAFKQKLSVESADALISIPFAIPKTGIFGLLDLVGLDLVPHIIKSMERLPKHDEFHQIKQIPELFSRMIATGYTGRKSGKGGFYRLNSSDGKPVKESINLSTGNYNKSEKPTLECLKVMRQQGLQAFLSLDDNNSRYAWLVMSKTLLYAASLIPEITTDISAVDTAMRLGYNWKYGPFELLDKIGTTWFRHKIQQQGTKIPELLTDTNFYKIYVKTRQYRTLSGTYKPIIRAKGVLLLEDIKLKTSPIIENSSASLWDIGDGVACFEFHSKMNTFDDNILSLLRLSLKKVKEDFIALVIYNDSENFSAGANLGLLMAAIKAADWDSVSKLIKQGQQTFTAIKYAPFPVVAAPTGMALGGGCEILLHCDAVQAHAELYTGLVEVGVGLIPAWGGCKEYLRRNLQVKSFVGPIPPVVKAFSTIATAKVSKSAAQAKELFFIRKEDGITMNKNHLLADAKNKTLMLSTNYLAPEKIDYKLPGKTAKILLDLSVKSLSMLGKVTSYDVEVADRLAKVLSGGDCDFMQPITEDELLTLEHQVFMEIVQQKGTVDRIKNMLETGKPLRN